MCNTRVSTCVYHMQAYIQCVSHTLFDYYTQYTQTHLAFSYAPRVYVCVCVCAYRGSRATHNNMGCASFKPQITHQATLPYRNNFDDALRSRTVKDMPYE